MYTHVRDEPDADVDAGRQSQLESNLVKISGVVTSDTLGGHALASNNSAWKFFGSNDDSGQTRPAVSIVCLLQ